MSIQEADDLFAGTSFNQDHVVEEDIGDGGWCCWCCTAGSEKDLTEWSRHHDSMFLDRLLCLLCLRAYPHGCCDHKFWRYLLPSLFVCSVITVWALHMMEALRAPWTLQTLQNLESSGETNALGTMLWITCGVGHLLSTLAAVEAGHGTFAFRHYFIANAEMSQVIDARTNTMMLKWLVLVVCTWLLLEVFFCFAIIVPFISSTPAQKATFQSFSLSGEQNLYIQLVTFLVTLLLVCQPQIVLNGLMTSRVQDLLDNSKITHVLLEQAIDCKEINVEHFHEVLQITRKMTAAIQCFSWEWQKLILGMLATPMTMGLMFTYNLLLYVGQSIGTSKNDGGMVIWFAGAVCAMYGCALIVLRVLSRVDLANYKLTRLIDFGLKRHHVVHPEINKIIKEMRHLIKERGAVKLYGVKITSQAVVKMVYFLGKALSLFFTVFVISKESVNENDGTAVGQNLNTTTSV
tara:strand:- start:31 stop:1413 length:1383 start_codon:yes stop_codon:yes gene_type:complete